MARADGFWGLGVLCGQTGSAGTTGLGTSDFQGVRLLGAFFVGGTP